VRFDASGLTGYNTDGPGFVAAVEHDFSVRLADLKVLIVGAGGGAGQAIATQ
jgi:shikimate dehydrogenase